MSNVIVSIAGRPYTMQCPDGEEDHLKQLAKLLDEEVNRIKQSVGAIGDIRLLVMAGLMVADRLSEATRKIGALEEQAQALKDTRNNALAQVKSIEDMFIRRMEEAADRMDKAAQG
jgi:cell division protein ZapA